MSERNFKEDYKLSKENHKWLLRKGIYKNMKLTEILDLWEQEFLGDFIRKSTNTYIEEKHNREKGECVFIETWSIRIPKCRNKKNIKNSLGWVYKQNSDVIIYRYNRNNVIKIDTKKLKKWWCKLYPNPDTLSNKQEECYRKHVGNFYAYNKTNQWNESEGFYVPVNILIQNKIGKIIL